MGLLNILKKMKKDEREVRVCVCANFTNRIFRRLESPGPHLDAGLRQRGQDHNLEDLAGVLASPLEHRHRRRSSSGGGAGVREWW